MIISDKVRDVLEAAAARLAPQLSMTRVHERPECLPQWGECWAPCDRDGRRIPCVFYVRGDSLCRGYAVLGERATCFGLDTMISECGLRNYIPALN